jgi:SAM-dependent methyltransferase
MSIDRKGYSEQIAELYRKQAASNDTDYLRAHSTTPAAIARQVEAAARYLPHVTGRVLDWGCMHAVDACLVRMYQGPDVEIHGCDLYPPRFFSVFHDFAQLQYQHIQPGYHIPYPDDYFDTIIADGVLEHVPNDHEALKELYRILRPDGLLVVACLPNTFSYLEFLAQAFGLPHHLRTYTMRTIRSMLLHSGFEITYRRYVQMMPTLSGLAMLKTPGWVRGLTSLLWSANRLLEKVWPINRLASNLFLMARKRLAITWMPCQAA